MRSKGKFRTQRTYGNEHYLFSVGGCDGCHSCEQTELCSLHRGLKSHGLAHLSCHQPTAKLQALIAAALELRGQCVDIATVPWHSQVPQHATREMLHMSALSAGLASTSTLNVSVQDFCDCCQNLETPHLTWKAKLETKRKQKSFLIVNAQIPVVPHEAVAEVPRIGKL